MRAVTERTASTRRATSSASSRVAPTATTPWRDITTESPPPSAAITFVPSSTEPEGAKSATGATVVEAVAAGLCVWTIALTSARAA